MHIDKIKNSKRQDFIYVHQNSCFEDSRIDGIIRDHTNQKGHILKQREKIHVMGRFQTPEIYKRCQRWLEQLYYSSLHKQALDMPLLNCWHSEQNLPEVNMAIVPLCSYRFWLFAYSDSQHDGMSHQHLLPMDLGHGAAIHYSRAVHKENNKTEP